MFTRMLRHARPGPERFTELAGDLFEVMAGGGRVGFETVAWFNGGLFDDSTTLPLEKSDIETVLAGSDLDWSEIDPSILRHAVRARPRSRQARPARGALHGPGTRSCCWSNRWWSARRCARSRPCVRVGELPVPGAPALKDIEHRVQFEAEALGFQRAFPERSAPANVNGIGAQPRTRRNWRACRCGSARSGGMRRNGFPEAPDPILKPLDTIECRDAILTADNLQPESPRRPTW